MKSNLTRLILWPLFLVIMILPGDAAHSADALRFGVLPVVDTLPLWVGIEEGYFAAENIELKMVPFQSALERDAALQAGRLDGYFGDLLNTVLLINAGQSLGIVCTAYHSHPGQRMFALVTAPGSEITDPEGLKGQAVAISRATVIEYLLDRFLAARSLPEDWVVKQEIKKMPIRLQMLLAGKIPAALLPEPLVTLAETKGAKALLDDRDLDASLTVLALKREPADARPDLAARFLKAYGAAVAAINGAPEKYKALLTAKTRVPKPVENQYQIPVFPEVKLPSPADVNAAQAWLIKRGMQQTPLAYEKIVLSAKTP